jgi:hypothetical protein
VTAVNDAEASEHYDPATREPAAGAPRRRPDRPLAQHVPVRFPRETIQRAKKLADADGVTVSSWIRSAVDEALRRRDSVGRRTSR